MGLDERCKREEIHKSLALTPVYLSDGGRVTVMESGGASQLLFLLERAVELPNTPDNHQLRLVTTGFLLNLLNSYDTVQVSMFLLGSSCGAVAKMYESWWSLFPVWIADKLHSIWVLIYFKHSEAM